MTQHHRHAITSLIIALGLGSMSLAYSQTDSTTPAGDNAPPPTKAQAKANSKAAHKAQRARKNAELKKLEKNGYNPSSNDPQYPDKLQKAEKKAGE